MALKVYRVWAQSISDVYLDVAAESEEEAMAIANDADGGDFIEDGIGDWIMGSVYEKKDLEPDEDMIESYKFWKEENA